MKCESGFVVDAVGDHGLAYGPAQFHKQTFYWMKQKAIDAGKPYFYLQYTDPSDQEALLVWGLENGYGDNWTCYRHLRRGV